VKLKDSLQQAIQRLTEAGVGSPRLNAEVLLMFTLACDRTYLYAHSDRELTADEQSRYNQAIDHRSQGIPSQYITGHQEFWGMDLIVSPAVLIPRPETEHLIEAVLPLAGGMTKPKIVDVGTGSGCVALALAKELPGGEIHATEISPAALEIAEANAARHQLEHRIKFHDTDLLQDLPRSYFDIVVSNPPYVGESEQDQVQLEVRKFEPRNAVFAGPTGLEIIQKLLPQAQEKLRPGGWLVFEISGTIAAGVRDQLSNWREVRIIPDLQGIPRVAVARSVV
jgi:release factor glutamine methyltransferase